MSGLNVIIEGYVGKDSFQDDDNGFSCRVMREEFKPMFIFGSYNFGAFEKENIQYLKRLSSDEKLGKIHPVAFTGYIREGGNTFEAISIQKLDPKLDIEFTVAR